MVTARRAAVPVAALILGGVLASAAPAAPVDTDTAPRLEGANAAILMSGSGEVLYTRLPDRRRAIASTTKLMTALLALERLSLGDLVSDAIAGITPVALSKGVRLEGRINGTDTDLVGSAPELARALRNILENAVRHTPADGSVMVEVGRTGPDAYVAVADSGGGVAPDALPRIFEVGFRGDQARSPGGGAGLGLAIAKSFVEAHRGRITVRNGEAGACFTVWLPVEAAR